MGESEQPRQQRVHGVKNAQDEDEEEKGKHEEQGADSAASVENDRTMLQGRDAYIRIRTVEDWWWRDDCHPQPMPLLVLSEGSPFASLASSRTSDGDSVARAISSPEMRRTRATSATQASKVLRVVHIPLSLLVDEERSFELPPRNEPFLILVEHAKLEAAERFLIGAGAGSGRAVPAVPMSTGMQREVGKALKVGGNSWSVAGAILDTLDARQQIHQLMAHSLSKLDDSYHLWRPDAMVEQYLLPLLQQKLACAGTANRRVEVWDLGSGVGRDVAFLARKLKSVHASLAVDGTTPPEIRVVGLDQRYRPRDAARFRTFMHRQGVDDVTECRLINLTSYDEVHNASLVREMRAEKPTCLYAVRYWNRPLFEAILRDAIPGTIVAITQFAKPTPCAEWPFPHPKEKHVLNRHELSGMFMLHGSWEVLRDEIVADNDHGRTLIQFVARKRADRKHNDEDECPNISYTKS